MSQDHFNSSLGDPEHVDTEQTHDTHDDITDVETTADSGRRKFPPKLVAGAVLALGVVGFWGFKKLNAPSGVPYVAQVPEQRQATADGGMLGAQSPAPQPQVTAFAQPSTPTQQMAGGTSVAQATGTFSAPPGAADSLAEAGKSAAESVASGTGASGAAAQESLEKTMAAAIADAPTRVKADRSDSKEILQALAETNAKLDVLTNRLSAVEGRSHSDPQTKTNASSTTKSPRPAKARPESERARERAAGVVRGTPGKRSTESKDETVVGYKIKQVIPGQAWLEDEAGRQIVKVKGDKLNGSEIVEIDADKYLVRTTAGVIR